MLPSKNSSNKNMNTCSFCGAAFTEKGNLLKHVSAVHEQKRHQCEFCEDHFAYRQDLNKHTARIHEGKGESYTPRKKTRYENNSPSPAKSPTSISKNLNSDINDLTENEDPVLVESETTITEKITENYREYSLPHGWKKVGHRRPDGILKNTWYFCVISPTGIKFPRTIDVNKYLDANPDIICDRIVTTTSLPDDLITPPVSPIKLPDFNDKLLDASVKLKQLVTPSSEENIEEPEKNTAPLNQGNEV